MSAASRQHSRPPRVAGARRGRAEGPPGTPADGSQPSAPSRGLAGWRPGQRADQRADQRTDRRPAGPAAGTGRPASPTPGGSRWRVPQLPLLAMLAVLVLLAGSAAVAVTLGERREQALSDARTAAVEQARTAAVTVLSYDHETLDEDFAAALALSTGEFAEEYARTSEAAVRPVAEETRAVVEADVVSAGVVSAGPQEVRVLLFVNQTTTSTRADGPRTDQNRVRMTMQKVGDRWLVSAVDAL